MMTFSLFILLILLILMILRGQKKVAAILLMIFTICFYIIGSGLVASFLLNHITSSFHSKISQLTTDKIATDNSIWKKNNAIIVLGAGNISVPQSIIIKPNIFGYARIYEAARLYFLCKKTNNKCIIITSGGDVARLKKSEAEIYQENLISLGIKKDDIILESQSMNSYKNAELCSAIIKTKEFDRIILVTSNLHMKRSLLYFNNFGIEAKAVIADYSAPTISLMPNGYNFAITDFIIHEYIGITRLHIYNFFGWK
jgi:uncharacterized SAM-binding protein YcdF (DUF218 family)